MSPDEALAFYSKEGTIVQHKLSLFKNSIYPIKGNKGLKNPTLVLERWKPCKHNHTLSIRVIEFYSFCQIFFPFFSLFSQLGQIRYSLSRFGSGFQFWQQNRGCGNGHNRWLSHHRQQTPPRKVTNQSSTATTISIVLLVSVTESVRATR
ncbi:MAG: hypothetical protein U0694_13785 [Anaerolineae bacterium]